MHALILPPQLELLPGLFAPSATFGAARARFGGALIQTGPHTLSELVRTLPGTGVRKVTVLEPLEDPAPARRIVETLLARGVETGCLPLAPEAPSAGSPGLVLLGATPDEEALALAVRRAAARAGGPHAVRLAFAEPRLPCDPEDGASWAARYGLDDPAWRAALLRLAAADLPHAAVQLHAAIGFQRLAVHPLCELFAGNGLFERNPELLQNIL